MRGQQQGAAVVWPCLHLCCNAITDLLKRSYQSQYLYMLSSHQVRDLISFTSSCYVIFLLKGYQLVTTITISCTYCYKIRVYIGRHTLILSKLLTSKTYNITHNWSSQDRPLSTVRCEKVGCLGIKFPASQEMFPSSKNEDHLWKPPGVLLKTYWG